MLPYDRWEGYGGERKEILNFIRDNGIENVEFLTTDNHGTLQNQVFIDKFTDAETIAHETITGPDRHQHVPGRRSSRWQASSGCSRSTRRWT